MTTDIYNLKHEKVGVTELPESVFGVSFKATVVKQVLDAQVANQHGPWAHAKTRGEVRGGGRKPWRQKGTGRARHGSTRSPIWIGGGKAHGPRNDKDYSQKVNRKMRRTAIAMILSKRLSDGELMLIDSMKIESPKTKFLASGLREFLGMQKRAKSYNALLIPSMEEKGIARAGANLPKSKVLNPASLNVYDLLNYRHILVDKEAIETISRTYKK